MLPEVNSTFWLKVLDDSCGEQRVLLSYVWLKVGHLYRNTNTEGPKKCLTHAHHGISSSSFAIRVFILTKRPFI